MKRFASFAPYVRRYQTVVWTFSASFGLLALWLTAIDSQPAVALTAPPVVQQGDIPFDQPEPDVNNESVLYVTADGTGTECSIAQPCYLHTAMDEAFNGSEVRVAAGLYDQEQGTEGATLSVNKSLNIIGGYTTTNWIVSDPETNVTILDGGGERRVVSLQSGTGSLEGFTVQNGLIATLGNGAGILVADGANQFIAYNRIHSNTNNGANQLGGGVHVRGEATLLANQIYNNSADLGGGVLIVTDGVVNLISNLIYENSSTAFGGGGIGSQSDGTINIWHNTIVDNSATATGGTGGGVALFVSSGMATVYNNIIANNTSDDANDGLSNDNVTIAGSHNNFFGNVTNVVTFTDTNTDDPTFVDAANDDYRLQVTSTLIDIATAGFPADVDFERQPRPFGGTADIGADEYYPAGATCFARVNDGTADGEIFTDPQTAIDQAQVDELVKIAGVCTSTDTQIISIDKTITVQGGYQLTNWDPAERGQVPTIFDGENARRLIEVTAGSPTIDSLHLINGNSTTGAAVYVTGGNPLVSNNVIYDNTTTTGGIIAAEATTTPGVQFNTIVDNTGPNAVTLDTNGAIQNNIIFNNTNNTTVGGTVTNFNLVGQDPSFVDAAGDNYRLMATSAALDVGDPNSTVATDFEGNTRPRNQRPDVGADEANDYPSVRFNPLNTVTDIERDTSINVPLELINDGTRDDTWDITVGQTQGWDVSFVNQAPNLTVGSSLDLGVVVTAPQTATPQTSETLVFTATSQLNPNAQTVTTIQLNVLPVRGVSISPENSISLLPGEVITFTHIVENLGESTDTFRIEILADPFEWGTLFTADSMEEADGFYDVVLASGETVQTKVQITVPEFAPAGFANELLLRAYSLAEPDVQDVVTDTVTAEATVGTRYVSTVGSDIDNNCRVLTRPCLTIERGINQAATGDAVYIAAGDYEQETEVAINTSITVIGGWREDFTEQLDVLTENTTVISADGLDRIFSVSGGATNATIESLTLRDGNRTSGGAVSIISNARVTISNTFFLDNQATRGGAIFSEAGTTTIVHNSRFRDNETTGENGGAIYSTGTLESFNSLYERNTALGNGGAIYGTNTAVLILWHNTLHQNQAQSGGAVYQTGGVLTARSNNFTNNIASGGSSTIHSAAGTYNADYNNRWNNSDPVSNRAIGVNSVSLDPVYIDGFYRLSPISPIIDIGDPNAPVDADFEANPRPSDQGFDIGWYELAGCIVRRDGVIYFSIQEAVDADTEAELIQVSGVCRGINAVVVDTTTVSQTVYLTKTVTIQGGWNADFDNDITEDPLPTFINPQGLGRGIYIGEGASPTIESIAIISGTAAGMGGGPADEDAGGGIYIADGAPTFSQVGVYSSTAIVGGGVYNDNGAPHFTVIGQHATVLENSAQTRVSDIAYNQATFGGGLYSNSTITLSNTFIRWNEAADGAGVYLNSGTALTLTNNVFYQNVATGDGGAIYNDAPNAQIWHQTIYENEAANGGGLYNAGDVTTLRNNIFEGNIATNNGPAIFHSGTAPDFDYNYYHGHASAPVSGTSLGGNSINSATSPGILDPTVGNFRLDPLGAAADIGDPATPIAEDFDEDVRPSNQGFDLGADEIASCYARVGGVIYGSPQIALQMADPGDQIDVAGLCLGVNIVDTGGPLGEIRQTLYISKNVTFVGGWQDDFSEQNTITTFDALGLGRVIYVAPGISTTIKQIDITGGNGSANGGNGNGGGIYIDQAPATLEMLDIYGNTATNGGGIYIADASTTVQMGNRIYDNTATNGAAAYIDNDTEVATIHSNFVYDNNAANNGGGFYNNAGDNLLLHNTFHNNTALGNGGGVYVAADSPQVRSSIFVTNTAGTGSAVFGQASTPDMGYNNFFNNTAGGTATGGVGNLSILPEFTSISEADYTIGLSSPMVNRGDPDSPITEDFEGDGRPSQQYADMGADEVGDCFARIATQPSEIYYSVQVAIDNATAGDTIEVDGLCMGVNQQTIETVESSQALYIDKDITIDGSWISGLSPYLVTTIDAVEEGRVLYVAPGVTAEVRNLYLINGDATVAGFDAGLGGGVYNEGALTFSRNHVMSNTATTGAGFYQTNTGSGSIERNAFGENVATGDGGAIYLDNATAVQNNFMYLNEATNGAGIYRNSNGTSGIWHNTIVSNTATSDLGAGIYVESTNGAVGNNLVHANTGSGIYSLVGGVDIRYNNVVGNSNGEYTFPAADVEGGISIVPNYIDPGMFDFHLFEDSAGVDVGDPSSPVNNDYDGDSRPINLGFDIGADEVGSCLIRVVGDGVNPTTDFGVLQEAIDYAEQFNLTELLVARGECTGVREKNGETQLAYITQNLNFHGSRARPDFAETEDYLQDNAYAPSSRFNATLDGRVLYIAPNANPTFNNIAFIGGQAGSGNGGVVYNAGNSGFYNVAMCEGEAANGGIFYNADEVGASANISGTTVRLGFCVIRVIVELDDGTELSNSLVPWEGGGIATQNGGVIYNDSPMILEGVATFDGTAQAGGGIYNNSQLDYANGRLVMHQATNGNGGGIYNTGNVIGSQFTNLVFYLNEASGNGGGIYHAAGAPLVLHHGTFNENTAANGGGVFNDNTTFTINSTIFYSNTATVGTFGAIQSAGDSSGLSYNNFFNNTPDESNVGLGTNVVTADPLLLGFRTLSVNSPAIDQADPSLIGADPRFTIDARAVQRPDGSTQNIDGEVSEYRSDIGAYEHIKLFSCEITPIGATSAVVDAGNVQLYEFIINNFGGFTSSGVRTGYLDEFNVSLANSSQTWGELVGGNNQTIQLGFDQTAVFTVSVQVPPGTLVSLIDETTITCESVTTGAIEEITLATSVAEAPGVIIEPDYPQITRKPGDVITYVHTITNTGNTSETFLLTASPGPNFTNAVFVDEDGSALGTDELTFDLEPGQDIEYTLQVTVRDDAPQGEIATPGANVTLLVNGVRDDSVTDSVLNPILIDFTDGTRYVAQGDTTDSANNCTQVINPCATVRHAIAQASPGDSIHIAAGDYGGFYTGTVGIDVVTQTLLINKPITIVGGFDSSDSFTQFAPITNVVRFTGENNHRVVYVTDGISVTLEGIFIANGFDELAGAGIYNQGADLTLKGVIVDSNIGTFGSGLYHDGGTLIVNSSVFWGNHNINSINGNGGGIYINEGDAVIENNTFSRNEATFVSSFVADPPPQNTASGHGGAIYQAAGSLTLLNNIFYENSGGNNLDDGNAPTSAYYITPTTTVITRGYNLYSSGNTPNLPYLSTEITDTNPLFVSESDFHLQGGSPALDAGTLEVFLGLDVDGEPRVMGVNIDIGADELFQEPDFLFAPEVLTATIDSGTLYTYTFTLTNTGDFIDSYLITSMHVPNGGTGWDYAVTPTAVDDLLVGQSVTVTLVITGGSPGFVDVSTLTAASVADPTLTRTVTATTRITQIAGVLFEPSRAGETEPGTPVVYTHTLTNTGNGPDTYQINVASQTEIWDVSIVPVNTAVILPNDSITVTVTITPPANTLAGVVHQAEITAISAADSTVSDTVTNTTTILPFIGLTIDPAAASYFSPDGQTSVYTHTVTSLSNVEDTVTIAVSTISGPDWTVNTSTPTVVLPPFGSAEISVSVDVPTNSLGEVHLMGVTATSTVSPAVQASAVNTTTVQTIQDVTFEPDRASSVTPGQTAVYNHTLTNSGNDVDSFTLAAVSTQGWAVTVDPINTGNLVANQSISVIVSVEVPVGTALDTVDVTTVTATSTSAVTVTDTVIDTTTVVSDTTPNFGVTIEPDNEATTLQGQPIFYYHTVTNTGSQAATIDLEASSSQGWTVTLNPVSVTLDSAETDVVEVLLIVPGTVPVDTVDTTVVTATNTADTTVFDTAVNTTTITDTVIADLTLLFGQVEQNGSPGELLEYNHTLTNRGNQGDVVTLTAVSENNWTVTVDPMTATLSSGQQTAVFVDVQIPADAAIGTTDRVTVTATSTNDPSVTATAFDLTTVVEDGASGEIYLPLIFNAEGDGNPIPTPTPVTPVPITPTPITPTPATPTPTASPTVPVGSHTPICLQPDYGTVAGVDLVVTSARIIPTNPAVGDAVAVEVIIRNQGDMAVTFGNNFYVDAYFNNVPDPQEPGLVFWGVQGSTMAAGTSRTFTAQVSFSQPGDYWIYAQVDTDGSVAEVNEVNNVLGGCTDHAFTVTGTARTVPGTPTAAPNGPRQTPTPAITFTPTTNSITNIATPTIVSTTTVSNTITLTATTTVTHTATPTIISTPTFTPTPEASVTVTPTAVIENTITPTFTVTPVPEDG